MATIYLIRHAESIANTQGIFQGQSIDSPLSALGTKQAEALGRRLRKTPIDRIYTSPLKRARETTNALVNARSAPIEVIEETALLETNHGQWEGISKDEVVRRWPRLYQLWLTKPSRIRFPQGEKFTDTAYRARRFLTRVLSQTGSVAVITHINIIQILLTHLVSRPLECIWDFKIQPTALTLITSHNPALIVLYNDTRHLENFRSDLSNHAL